METRVTMLAGLLGASLLAGTPAARAEVDWRAVGAALARQVDESPEAAALFAPIRRAADDALGELPDPIALIRSQGLLATDPLKVRTRRSLADMKKLDALAWTWLVTGDARYSARAGTFLRAWADVNRSKADPIDDTNLGPAIRAYAVVRDTLDAGDRAAIEAWFRQVAEAHVRGPQRKNNWQNHSIKIVGLIGEALPDAGFAAFARDAWRRQLEVEMLPDGATTDFHERDALHYHLYSLQPLLDLAVGTGDAELYRLAGTGGASLERCVQFLLPYARREREHVEFVNSKVAFDRKRAANGEAGYVPHAWSPESAIGVLTAASLFDARLDDLIATLAGKPAARYASWDALVVSVRRAAPTTRP